MPLSCFPRHSSCSFSRFLRSCSLFFVCFNQRNARLPVCIAPGRVFPLSTRCALVRPGSVKRAPSRYLFYRDFLFSFCIHFICFVFPCSSLRILFFSRINYTAAHPSPSLYTNALFPSPKQTLCAFSLVRLQSLCLVLTPCPVCAVCYARFGFPNGKRRPRFLPFFAQNKRGRLALFVHCAVLFFLSASIQSGRYFSTLALCSSSVLLNTVSPVSGSPKQKYKYPFK